MGELSFGLGSLARFREFPSLVIRDQGINHLLNVPVEKEGDIVAIFADAMVGDSILVEIVGSNLFAAISGPNEAASKVATFPRQAVLLKLIKL